MTYSKTASSASVSKKCSPSTSPLSPSSMIRKNGASASKPGRPVTSAPPGRPRQGVATCEVRKAGRRRPGDPADVVVGPRAVAGGDHLRQPVEHDPVVGGHDPATIAP